VTRPIFKTVSREPLVRIYDEAGPFVGQRVKYRPIEVEGVRRGYFAHRPSGWRYTGGWGVYSLLPEGWHDHGSAAASGQPSLVSSTSHDRDLALGWIARLLEQGRLPAPEDVPGLLAERDHDLANRAMRAEAEKAEREARYAAQRAERERREAADAVAKAEMLEGLVSLRDRGDLTNLQQAAVVEALRRFER
jgi:hypothetical protein